MALVAKMQKHVKQTNKQNNTWAISKVTLITAQAACSWPAGLTWLCLGQKLWLYLWKLLGGRSSPFCPSQKTWSENTAGGWVNHLYSQRHKPKRISQAIMHWRQSSPDPLHPYWPTCFDGIRRGADLSAQNAFLPVIHLENGFPSLHYSNFLTFPPVP